MPARVQFVRSDVCKRPPAPVGWAGLFDRGRWNRQAELFCHVEVVEPGAQPRGVELRFFMGIEQRQGPAGVLELSFVEGGKSSSSRIDESSDNSNVSSGKAIPVPIRIPKMRRRICIRASAIMIFRARRVHNGSGTPSYRSDCAGVSNAVLSTKRDTNLFRVAI